MEEQAETPYELAVFRAITFGISVTPLPALFVGDFVIR